jgi:thiamine-phosphate pyrophosphorylase
VKRPIVCVVTDGGGDVGGTLQRIRAAVEAGVALIQIREPRLTDPVLIDLTRRACEAAGESGPRVLVNDRLDVALAAGAHGVHLRGNSFSAARVRERVGNAVLVGRSVHECAEAIAIDREGGCDYLLFGTVFPSRSKPAGHPVAGLEALREVCRQVRLPVIAIGGITLEHAASVSATGAAGIAAIGLFGDIRSMRSTVESVRQSFDT